MVTLAYVVVLAMVIVEEVLPVMTQVEATDVTARVMEIVCLIRPVMKSEATIIVSILRYNLLDFPKNRRWWALVYK